MKLKDASLTIFYIDFIFEQQHMQAMLKMTVF